MTDTANSPYARSLTVAVVGLGKIGLPLAAQFARHADEVIGCDSNPQVAEAVDTGAVDYRMVDSATRDVARGLQPGTLVIYETTLPVGTTRTRLGPLLEAGS